MVYLYTIYCDYELGFVNLIYLLLLLSVCERIYTFGLHFNFKSIIILNRIVFNTVNQKIIIVHIVFFLFSLFSDVFCTF